MARFRRRRRGVWRRVLRRKPRAYIRRGRVMKAAYRTSRLSKGADTIVTRTSSECHSSMVFPKPATLFTNVRFGSSYIIRYCPFEADSGGFLIGTLDPRTGWIGLSDRFVKLCSIYDTFKINYIKFDISITTPANFSPSTYVSKTLAMGLYEKEIQLGVLVDRCNAYGSTHLNQDSYAEFWTDPATIITNCRTDQYPRIVVTVKPRRGESNVWWDTPDSSSGRYLPEYHNKSVVSGFLPAFYYAVRVSGEPEEFREFLKAYNSEYTIQGVNAPPFCLPLKIKVTYGVTFRGSLNKQAIVSAKVAEVVNPTERMEEFDLKGDTEIRVDV